MKNLFIKLALVICVFALATACDQTDDAVNDSIQSASSPTANVTLDFANNQTFVETDMELPFTVTLTEAQIVDIVIHLSLSGTATEHDDVDYPHSLRIPAGSTSVSDVIVVHRDTDPEDTETAIITIGSDPVSNATMNVETVTLTLEDYVFCNWILETSDTYGDGWNGGYIEVVSEGVTTQYAEDDDEATTFEITITDGADYSFTYVSGGGTGAGPGWESENYYKLTAPDGTVWEDGTMDYSGIPTPGLITSGTNNCP